MSSCQFESIIIRYCRVASRSSSDVMALSTTWQINEDRSDDACQSEINRSITASVTKRRAQHGEPVESIFWLENGIDLRASSRRNALLPTTWRHNGCESDISFNVCRHKETIIIGHTSSLSAANHVSRDCDHVARVAWKIPARRSLGRRPGLARKQI